jgi:hypothetical protein
MRFGKAAIMLAVLLVGALPALAQETTGTIKGKIVDAQGLAVPGATVTITGTQGAKNTVTDSEGRYAAVPDARHVYRSRRAPGIQGDPASWCRRQPRADRRHPDEDGRRRID